VLEVVALKKAFHQPCPHLGKTVFGPGCMIYASRPHVCQTYVCLWLDSQRRPDVDSMPESLRPDVCKVVLGNPGATPDTKVLWVYPYSDHPDAWRRPPVSDYLRVFLSRGAKLMVKEPGGKVWAIRGDTAIVGEEEEFAQL
jgi:hypothetical protein